MRVAVHLVRRGIEQLEEGAAQRARAQDDVVIHAARP